MLLILKLNNMKTFHLIPVNDRKSFNGKCHVNEYTNNDGDHYSDLISYGIRVASYDHEYDEMSVYGWYSNSTMAHINAFLDFYGFDTCTKQELEEYYLIDKKKI